METPSSTMYADLKSFGHVSNRNAAWLLLSPEPRHGGLSLRDRANDRTFLSREVVHAKPQEAGAWQFGDLAQTSLTLASRIVTALGDDARAREALAEHYRTAAAQDMCAALRACGLDATLYENALAKIVQTDLPSERDRGILLLMLFVATGCLGNPASAIEVVEDYATSKLSRGLYTTETEIGEGYTGEDPEQGGPLALLRIVDGMAKPPLRPLSTAPEGTVIGALASGPDDITDVDRDVSRRHLRIWREGTRWYAQGLGSTNGTTVVAGDTRETRVIEPPRGKRAPGAAYPPVEILNSDVLCLGATTQFLVMRTIS